MVELAPDERADRVLDALDGIIDMIAARGPNLPLPTVGLWAMLDIVHEEARRAFKPSLPPS